MLSQEKPTVSASWPRQVDLSCAWLSGSVTFAFVYAVSGLEVKFFCVHSGCRVHGSIPDQCSLRKFWFNFALNNEDELVCKIFVKVTTELISCI